MQTQEYEETLHKQTVKQLYDIILFCPTNCNTENQQCQQCQTLLTKLENINKMKQTPKTLNPL